ncbi:MAG: hypothetical protein ABII90_01705, partial [Bacteroidota bacterium]
MVKPVTPDKGSLTLVTTAVPAMTDQVSVSVPATALAASVAVVILQMFWSGPAAETVVVGSEFIITSSKEAVQP